MNWKEVFERTTKLKLKDITAAQTEKNGGHEIGKKYFCGYWRQVYEVIDIQKLNNSWAVVCKWQDGETNVHSTDLTPGRDFEVIG